MQELENKITRFEYDIKSQEARILNLEAAFKELHSSLNGIQNLLMQIKWIVVGALLVVALTDGTLGNQLMKMLS